MAMFELHLPTLWAVLVLLYAASFTFALVLYLAKRRFAGAFWWLVGQVFLVVGAVGVALRDTLPWLLAVFAANVPFVAAAVVFLRSVWAFCLQRRFPLWIYLVIPLAVGLFAVDLSQDVRFRSILFSGLLAFLNGSVAFVMLTHPPKSVRLPMTLVAITFLGLALANLARIPGYVVADEIRFGNESGFGAIFYFLSALTPVLILFSYYLLSGTRLERERLTREERLQTQNAELARFNRMTTTLLSVIGHDVKTPLAAAHRYVSRFLVKAPSDLETKKRELEVLEQTLGYSTRILENLVSFAKAQVRGLPEVLGTVSLREVIHLSVDYVAQEADRKGVALVVSDDKALQLVCGEEQWLAIIVRNLVANAVKFSHPGGEVIIECLELAEQSRLTVRDHGVGMPQEQVDRLMSDGEVSSTLGTAGERGSGIGLALVKVLCTQLKIEISINSTEGRGTEVTLDFPKRQSAGADGCRWLDVAE